MYEGPLKERRISMNDASIIELYWNRNENAIEETHKKYGSLCNRVSLNIVNSIPDAEECVNDSYLTLWNSIPDDRPEYFSAYLCRIVRNLSLKRLEYNTALKRKPELVASFDELEGCISSADTPENSLDAKLLGKAISEFLYLQNEQCRNIFIRRYWYFDSVKNIAEDFRMKEEKVSVLLFRMRKKLKKHLEKEGFGV